MLNSECPQYDKLVEELNSSDEIQSKLKQNKDLLNYLSTNIGQNVTTIDDVEYLYDALFIEVEFIFSVITSYN